MMDSDGAVIDEQQAEIDQLRAENEKLKKVIEESCVDDEKHCACVPYLRLRMMVLEEKLRAALNDEGAE